MKDRIRQLMEAQHMTQQTFANFLGISPATLSSIFQGRTKPTLNTVESINSKFPNINLDWLMFGKGGMFNDQDGQPGSSSALSEGGAAGEQTLNFSDAVEEQSQAAQPQQVAAAGFAGRGAQKARVRTDIICNEREPRRITEIRVFYDDQTWESFVPKK